MDTAAVRLGTVEEADFGACTECLLDGFYKDMLTLASDEFSAEEMLDALSSDGLSLSVATAKPEVTAHPILDYFNISHRFAVRAGATLTPDRRAKAEVIEFALGELGISGDPDLGNHVIMVGDRDHDVLGAKRHGIPCIGVTWGYGDPPELLGSGAVALADSPAEVVDLVHESYRLNHW